MTKFFMLLFFLLQQYIHASSSSDGFDLGIFPEVGRRFIVPLEYDIPNEKVDFNDFGHVSGGWVFKALEDAGKNFSKNLVHDDAICMDQMSSHVLYKKPVSLDSLPDMLFYSSLKSTTDHVMTCLVEMVKKDVKSQEFLYASGVFDFFIRDISGKKIQLPDYLSKMGEAHNTKRLYDFPSTFDFVSWPEKLLNRKINTMNECDASYLFHVLDVAGKTFCERLLGKDEDDNQRKVVTASSHFECIPTPKDRDLKLRVAFIKAGTKSLDCVVEIFSTLDDLINASAYFTFVHAVKGDSLESVIPQLLPYNLSLSPRL